MNTNREEVKRGIAGRMGIVVVGIALIFLTACGMGGTRDRIPDPPPSPLPPPLPIPPPDEPSPVPPIDPIPYEVDIVSCETDNDCVVLELGCCDYCNGGRLAAVNLSHSEEVTERNSDSCPERFACTLALCSDYRPKCTDNICGIEYVGIEEFFPPEDDDDDEGEDEGEDDEGEDDEGEDEGEDDDGEDEEDETVTTYSGWRPSISENGGFVAFVSRTTNNIEEFPGIFVRDVAKGRTEYASAAIDGGLANGESHQPSISANGRYVVFSSEADNLVKDDENGTSDVFIRDLENGTTKLVNTTADGRQSDGWALNPSISADGRYVAFVSNSFDMAAYPEKFSGHCASSRCTHIFVKDMNTDSIRLVNISHDWNIANDMSFSPMINADGRYVTFTSYADNLVKGDNNNKADIFIRDIELGQTELVSVSSDDVQTNKTPFSPYVSSDGRYVVFYSLADNLVAEDSNGKLDVFVRDRLKQTTEIASVADDNSQSNGVSAIASISADGRFVAFSSTADNLVPDDTNDAVDIFVRDLDNGTTERVHVADDGSEADHTVFYGDKCPISADGKRVAFTSLATNLVPTDSNQMIDVFIRDIYNGQTIPISF